MPVRRPLMSRVLALPDRGEPQRKTALLGYGILASAVAFTGTFAMQRPAAQESARGPARTAPDAAPHEVEAANDDVLAETPDEDRVPTFFDGRGGLAGVELTEEQRKAVIKEALHRGMTEEQAHELAYGEDEPSGTVQAKPQSPTVTPPKETDGAKTHVLASGPLYRQVAPEERDEVKKAQKKRRDAAHASGSGRDGKPSATSGDGEGKDRKLTDQLDAVIPDPLEEVVGDLLPFRLWMAQVADPETEPTWNVDHDPEEGTVTVTAESQMSDHMAVRAEIVAPVVPDESSDDPTVTVTVTDPTTDEVIVEPTSQSAAVTKDVPRVAIGEVVDAVIEAQQATDEEPQPSSNEQEDKPGVTASPSASPEAAADLALKAGGDRRPGDQ